MPSRNVNQINSQPIFTIHVAKFKPNTLVFIFDNNYTILSCDYTKVY